MATYDRRLPELAKTEQRIRPGTMHPGDLIYYCIYQSIGLGLESALSWMTAVTTVRLDPRYDLASMSGHLCNCRSPEQKPGERP